ncbi:MmcQ/YjbR family DNA-binding protein [Blautia schinkii]|nr:MmcQ/YjbR family DNA-binding protein [Blautia schinkii]
MQEFSLREKVLQSAEKQYHTRPESLWPKYPKDVVLRHSSNNKWYGLLMNVPRNRLGLEGEELVDILNVKADSVMAGAFLLQDGIMPAYHMNKGKWLTILLDDTVPMETIELLLDTSFELTDKKKSKKSGVRNTEWIVPANPKFYDIEAAINESTDGAFIWKQSNHICVGDKVYLYVAAPVSAIQYKCKAVEVDIPYEYSDKNVSMSKVMRLQLLKRYDEVKIDFALLKEYGVSAVRGPRSMPNRLKCRIEELYGAHC